MLTSSFRLLVFAGSGLKASLYSILSPVQCRSVRGFLSPAGHAPACFCRTLATPPVSKGSQASGQPWSCVLRASAALDNRKCREQEGGWSGERSRNVTMRKRAVREAEG